MTSKISSNSSTNEGGILGNTKQISPAKRWCFTYNNYKIDDIEYINNNSSKISNFWIIGLEVGESGTPHLQGYIEFNKKLRPKNLYNERIHWEKAKGNKEQNFKYCTKEGNYYLNGKKIRPVNIITKLNKWQTDLCFLLKQDPDNRTIHWYWDENGNTGKSSFVKYMCHHHGAIVLSGKTSDMKYGIIKYYEKHKYYPEIVFIDIPRSVNTEFLCYTGIEEIKNGCFFSSKYEGDMVIMPTPHIVIFANEKPVKEKLSKDRWDVVKLDS